MDLLDMLSFVDTSEMLAKLKQAISLFGYILQDFCQAFIFFP